MRNPERREGPQAEQGDQGATKEDRERNQLEGDVHWVVGPGRMRHSWHGRRDYPKQRWVLRRDTAGAITERGAA